jgi:streptogramin lyase
VRFPTRYPFGSLLLGLALLAAVSLPAEPQPLYRFRWGIQGVGAGQFDAAYGVAVDIAGNVYVADSSNHRIQKFNADGAFLRTWGWGVTDGSSTFQVCTARCGKGISGSGNGQFDSPAGVAVDASGNVYVADRINDRIQKFDYDGAYLDQWGSFGDLNGQFNYPVGVAVDASGYVYVSEYEGHRIQKFDSSGSYQTKWGSFGRLDGELDHPAGIAVDGTGRVYVVDVYPCRIQVFESGGAFLGKWGDLGTGNGEFNSPYGVGIDAAGDVYVVDRGNDRIQKFDSNGGFLGKWGTSCSVFMNGVNACDGEFLSPQDIAFNSTGRIYVADTDNDRIQVFAKPSMEVFVGDLEPAIADQSSGETPSRRAYR